MTGYLLNAGVGYFTFPGISTRQKGRMAFSISSVIFNDKFESYAWTKLFMSCIVKKLGRTEIIIISSIFPTLMSGSVFRISHFQATRFCASLTICPFPSLSVHLRFGLPFILFPAPILHQSFINKPSSLLITGPLHFNLLS